MMKYSKGFSLIELMVVIAILGIITAMALPSFSLMLEKGRLKTAVQALADDLQHARILAIKQSKNIKIVRTTGTAGSWCYGYNDAGTACSCTQTTTTAADYCNVKRVSGTDVSNTVNITSVSATTTFDFKKGTANASNTCFSTANFKAKVVVSDTGRITICSDTTAPISGYAACTTNCP